jgi:predicted signal transduction protein with EAL and GGDEF domain
VARLGGDEFALIIPNLHDRASAEVVARKIIDHMTAPFRLDGRELSVTASMGMVFFPEHGSDADDLLKKADIALYRAKALGRNNFQIFSLGLEEVGLARRELEAQIRQALVTEDFFLEYQPKLDLRTGKLCGAEALIRWDHPTLGRLPPDKFIPLAEESRLIIPLGNWIINEVARQQAAWCAEGLLVVPVAVNLSTMQFKNDDLPLRFSEALRQHNIGAALMELEITESLLMENPERIRLQLAELDAMGIGIAIDDFGTGYSSLSYLRTLPVNVLKIDRSFVRDIETTDDRITQAIIAMAKSLNLEVVAEGAETSGQIEHLRKLGCDVIQGYAYSRPLAAEVFAIFLRAPSDEEVSALVE